MRELPTLSSPQYQALSDAGFADMRWCEQLCAGTSNQNYRIEVNGKSWVLRVNNPLTACLCPRPNEVDCWRSAAHAGLAPALTFVSDDYSIYISEFVHQSAPWAESHGSHPRALTMVSELLTGLAALPLPRHRVSPASQWQYYQAELQQRLRRMERELRKAAQRILLCAGKMDSCLQRLASGATEQFCHRDLNPNNLLLSDNKLLCIDFEYACASDPRFELAALIASHSIPNIESLQTRCLSATQSPDDMIYVNYCYWVFTAAWGIIMCQDGKSAMTWLHDALEKITALEASVAPFPL